MIIYTIGHSNRKITDFISILKRFDVEVLIDIRTFPFSKYVPDYNKENISEKLVNNGIEYVYKGDKLGGMPAEGFDRYRSSERYNQALHDLLNEIISNKKIVVLMCAEKDYNNCHRRFVSEDLGKIILENNYHIEIEHIVDESGIDKTLDQFMD